MGITKFLSQFLCYFLELLPAFSCGFQLSYSSVAVPRHEEEGADIPLELEEASWFGKNFLMAKTRNFPIATKYYLD